MALAQGPPFDNSGFDAPPTDFGTHRTCSDLDLAIHANICSERTPSITHADRHSFKDRSYLDRAKRILYKDTNTYAVPSNLELLVSILIGIIENTQAS
jgi:hypothetical protein